MVLFGGCTSAQGDGRTSSAVGDDVTSETRPPIAPVDVSPAAGSPDWCGAILTESLRELPSAIDGLVGFGSTSEVIEVLSSAADDLAALPSSAPQVVRSAATDAAASLRSLAAAPDDPTAAEAAGVDLTALDELVQPDCEIS